MTTSSTQARARVLPAGGRRTETPAVEIHFNRDDPQATSDLIQRQLCSAAERAAEAGRPITIAFVVHPPAGSGRAAFEAAVERAQARGAAQARDILNQEDMASSDRFAELAGVSRETVNQWRRNRSVIALDGPRHGYRYPIWQISDTGRPFRVIAEVASILNDSGWTCYRFFRRPHGQLGGETAIDALGRRQIESIRAAALSFANGDFG